MSKAWMNLESAWARERLLDAEVGMDLTPLEDQRVEEGLYRRDPDDECLEPPYDWERERAA